jgi:hypothetical protein
MAERKKVLLRLDPSVHDAVARWAADDLRSVNAQIEYALRRALRAAGRDIGPEASGSGTGASGAGGASASGAGANEHGPGARASGASAKEHGPGSEAPEADEVE